jgi:hypothetical protein
VDNIERVLTRIDEITGAINKEASGELLRIKGQLVNHDRPALVQAIREWFSELRKQPAEAYELFAERVVQPGDCVISFNYDVSLEKQLKLAGLWEVGDGYHFPIEGLAAGSSVKLLKLHGSANWLDEISFETRPLIGGAELEFLGYVKVDPEFPGSRSAAIPPLILPTACKRFYHETSFGRKREDFWNQLWAHATLCLNDSERVVLCGYSLPPIDDRACRLLLEGEYPGAVEVCCGDDTAHIVRQLGESGHRAQPAGQTLFQDWVKSQTE